MGCHLSKRGSSFWYKILVNMSVILIFLRAYLLMDFDVEI